MALKGPLRIRTATPKKYTEGYRDSYPEIHLNQPNINEQSGFSKNTIYTTKYTIWSFIPKFLFEQFRKATSLYFLIICIITTIPQVSPFNPLTSWGGLIFILVVAGVREAYEDYLRLKADFKVNNAQFTTLQPQTGVPVVTRSYNVSVGDLVYLKSDERVPVDFVLLKTSRGDSAAFIETAQLDGETNLKIRKVCSEDIQGLTTAEVSKLQGIIKADTPNHHLYTFKGSLELDGSEDPTSLDENHLMLTGSTLRNTEWVIGVCVYAGPESKLGLNLKLPPSKFSSLDKKLNLYVLSIFIFKLVLVVAMTIYNGIFNTQPIASIQELIDVTQNSALLVVQVFVIYFALMSYLIPLSLVVTLDILRFFQASFITWDEHLTFDNKKSTAKTSNLNDELALVDYIFSDKTGTLTENLMVFKKASINGVIYDDSQRDATIARLVESSSDKITKKKAKEYLYVLALAHSCQVDQNKDDQMLSYNSASPDEEALCNAARDNRFVYLGREGKWITLNVLGKEEKFELLVEMEFTSDRRRMSVIVKDNKGKIKMFTKGADAVIAQRLHQKKHNMELFRATSTDLEAFSIQGLRTLLLAKKEFKDEEYERFIKIYNKAANLIEGREEELDRVCSDIETDLTLIGATAIEDRLQDGVPEAIYNLRQASIKVWVITGDKQETAINIGYSTNLLSRDLELVLINANTSEETFGILQQAISKFISPKVANPGWEIPGFAIVVDGKTLTYILADHQKEFMKLGAHCASAICNRVTPLQKAEIVKMVQDSLDTVCLSIGDGGNDVSMIQQAHIGVGIKGREGAQAARAADFAIPKFKALERLLLVHGRYALLRNTKVIYSSFYKNATTFLILIWYSIFIAGSGQTLYGDFIMTFYNIIFTSLPVFSLGMFEKDLREWIIEKKPEVYQDVKVLKYTGLIKWLCYAIYHSLLIFWVCYGIFGDSLILPDGTTSGLRLFGTFVITVSFHVVLVKLLMETQYLVFPTAIAFGLSLFGFYIWMLLECYSMSVDPNYYYVFDTLARTGTLWLTMLLCVVACLIPDISFKYLGRQLFPKGRHLLQEQFKRREQLANSDIKIKPLLSSAIEDDEL